MMNNDTIGALEQLALLDMDDREKEIWVRIQDESNALIDKAMNEHRLDTSGKHTAMSASGDAVAEYAEFSLKLRAGIERKYVDLTHDQCELMTLNILKTYAKLVQIGMDQHIRFISEVMEHRKQKKEAAEQQAN